MKNIMITGAGGFVGKSLSEYLKEKYNIYALKHTDLDLLNENQVKNFFDSKQIDFVIHCANTGGTRKNAYDRNSNDVTQNNLKMFFNIVRCLGATTKMIHFGSGAEYDKRYPLQKIAEEEFDVNIPSDVYGYSKYIMSKYIEKCENIKCLRIFGLYGKYEDYTFKFISNAILKNLIQSDIVINQNVVFDYLYIDDLMRIVEKFIEEEFVEKVYNVVPTESIDLIKISNIINKVSSYESNIVVLHDGLNKEYSANNSRLLKELGEFQFTSYEDGIRSLYDYYKSVINSINVDAIKEDKYLKFCKNSD